MANHQIKKIGVPTIQRDGRSVSLVLQSEDDTDITLTIHSDDLSIIIERLLDALDSVKVTQALWNGDANAGKQPKAAPTVYQAEGIGFVGGDDDAAQYIVLSTPDKSEIHIRLEADQVRTLVAQIREVKSIQIVPPDAPPS